MSLVKLSDALDALEAVPRRFSAKAQFLAPVPKREIEFALGTAQELKAEVESHGELRRSVPSMPPATPRRSTAKRSTRKAEHVRSGDGRNTPTWRVPVIEVPEP